MKKILVTLVFAISAFSVCSAQALGRHTYCHIDITTGMNGWTLIGSMAASNLLNELTHSNIFEASSEYDIKSGETNGEKMGFKNYGSRNFFTGDGITAKSLFQIVQPSLKIGYISSLPNDFNWGVYAVGGYRFQQFQVSPIKADEIYSKQEIQRCLVGGSVFAVIGGTSKSIHLMVEAGARYNMGLNAKGVLGDNDAFSDGITSHYAVKVTGSGIPGDFGIFADVDHFDYLKSDVQKMNKWSIGFTYCLTFGQKQMYGSNLW